MQACGFFQATCDVTDFEVLGTCAEDGSIAHAIRQNNFHPFPCEGYYTYEGEEDETGKPHGMGVMIWPKGDIKLNKTYQYRGQFFEGKAHGHGEYRHAFGSTYDGQWVMGKAEGYGEYIDENYVIYKGQWFQNLQHGHGEESWGDSGSKYHGGFEMGTKRGDGVFSWSKDEFYQGQFTNDQFDGVGSFFWQDGRSFTGSWAKGKMDGKGLFTWPCMSPKKSLTASKRKWYLGDYSSGKKHGSGIYHFADGREYEGEWSNGEQCGEGNYATYLGVTKRGTWEAGDRHPKEWNDPDENE